MASSEIIDHGATESAIGGPARRPPARFFAGQNHISDTPGGSLRGHRAWALVAIWVVLVLLARTTHAGDGKRIFRYRDARGMLQIASVLPPDQAQAGYEILDASTLRTLAVVAPTPTVAQRAEQERLQHQANAARNAAREAEQAQHSKIAARWQRDRMLLQTYASEADLLALRDAKLESLKLIESSVDNSIGHLRVNLARMDSTIAEHKAAGRAPPPRLQAARDQTAADLAEQQRAAERLQVDRAATRQRFEDDLQRYRELTATR